MNERVRPESLQTAVSIPQFDIEQETANADIAARMYVQLALDMGLGNAGESVFNERQKEQILFALQDNAERLDRIMKGVDA